MKRFFLWAACLLVCFACATPFPFESLEEGMTAETVLEEFGEPESIRGSDWVYTHEVQEWFGTAYCVLFAPACALMSPISLLAEGKTFFHAVGVDERPVFLYFEAGKLDHFWAGPEAKIRLVVSAW